MPIFASDLYIHCYAMYRIVIPEKFVIHLWSFVFKNKIHKRFVAFFSKAIVFLPIFAPDKQYKSLTKQLSNEYSALGAFDFGILKTKH